MKYAEDISCIVDKKAEKGSIFIGNLEASQNLDTLKKHNIKAVLTAAKGIQHNHPKKEVPFILQIPGQDHQRFDISKYFHQSVQFIHECLQRTNILVHCLAGVSRSVSLVIAYFIKHQGMTYDEAYRLVKSKRRIIHPNDGFIDQLKRYELKMREEKPMGRSQVQLQRSSSMFSSPQKIEKIPQNSPSSPIKRIIEQSRKEALKRHENSYNRDNKSAFDKFDKIDKNPELEPKLDRRKSQYDTVMEEHKKSFRNKLNRLYSLNENNPHEAAKVEDVEEPRPSRNGYQKENLLDRYQHYLGDNYNTKKLQSTKASLIGNNEQDALSARIDEIRKKYRVTTDRLATVNRNHEVEENKFGKVRSNMANSQHFYQRNYY